MTNWNEANGFAYILATQQTACCPVSPIEKAPVKKMGKPMRYNARYDEEYCDGCDCEMRPANDNQRKVSYATDRIYMIYSKHETALRKQFFMDEITPDSVEDLIQRMKDGKYTVMSKEKQEERTYWNKWDFIIWRTPDEVKDEAGFKKAVEALNDARIKAADAAQLLSSEAAAAALTEFEGWTYSA